MTKYVETAPSADEDRCTHCSTALRRPRGDHLRGETTKTKRTTGATDGPKSFTGFSLAIALPCRQLTAHRLAGCCRVDARFTLAFWTLALGRWPLDTGPVGRRSPSALVAWALVVFGSGRCEKPARSTADNPTADPTNSPDDYKGCSIKFRSSRLSKHAPSPPAAPARSPLRHPSSHARDLIRIGTWQLLGSEYISDILMFRQLF